MFNAAKKVRASAADAAYYAQAGIDLSLIESKNTKQSVKTKKRPVSSQKGGCRCTMSYRCALH